MLNPGPLASYIGFTEDEVPLSVRNTDKILRKSDDGTTAICLEITMYTIQTR